MVDKTLNNLTDFAVDTQYHDLPDDVERIITEVLVDTLGCAIGGRDCIAASIAESYSARGVEGQAGRVVGRKSNVPPDLAAFWNTSMIRYLDFNDCLTAGHPSDTIGGLFAMVDISGASGRDIITATVISYEIYARLTDTVLLARTTLDQGYAVCIAAAAGISRLLGLSREQTRHAISIAATSGVPLRATRSGQLSHYKGAATAVATRSAAFFAALAQGGLTGPSGPFEGRHGIVELLEGEAGSLDLQNFLDWRTRETWLKLYPVAYNMTPSVCAALELREVITADNVAGVTLHAAPFSYHESGSEPEKWDPQTRETADHSLPYAFAHAYRHGTIDRSAFEPTAYRDPDTLAFMQRIAVVPDWGLGPVATNVVGVRAEVLSTSGVLESRSILHPRGHHENPMTRREVAAKARRLLLPHLGDGADAAIEACWAMSDEPSFARVLDLFEVHPV